jgi:hypothetical protein
VKISRHSVLGKDGQEAAGPRSYHLATVSFKTLHVLLVSTQYITHLRCARNTHGRIDCVAWCTTAARLGPETWRLEEEPLIRAQQSEGRDSLSRQSLGESAGDEAGVVNVQLSSCLCRYEHGSAILFSSKTTDGTECFFFFVFIHDCQTSTFLFPLPSWRTSISQQSQSSIIHHSSRPLSHRHRHQHQHQHQHPTTPIAPCTPFTRLNISTRRRLNPTSLRALALDPNIIKPSNINVISKDTIPLTTADTTLAILVAFEEPISRVVDEAGEVDKGHIADFHVGLGRARVGAVVT